MLSPCWAQLRDHSPSTFVYWTHVGKDAGTFGGCLLDAFCMVSSLVLVWQGRGKGWRGAGQGCSWGLSCPGGSLSDSDDNLDDSGDRTGSRDLPALTTALPSIQPLSCKHTSPAVSMITAMYPLSHAQANAELISQVRKWRLPAESPSFRETTTPRVFHPRVGAFAGAIAEQTCRCGRVNSVVRSTGCSSEEPMFNLQHTVLCKSRFRGSEMYTSAQNPVHRKQK